jgi:hypothetical protein
VSASFDIVLVADALVANCGRGALSAVLQLATAEGTQTGGRFHKVLATDAAGATGLGEAGETVHVEAGAGSALALLRVGSVGDARRTVVPRPASLAAGIEALTGQTVSFLQEILVAEAPGALVDASAIVTGWHQFGAAGAGVVLDEE